MAVQCLTMLSLVFRHFRNILSSVQLLVRSIYSLHILRAVETAAQDGEDHIDRGGLGSRLWSGVDGSLAWRGHSGHQIRPQ